MGTKLDWDKAKKKKPGVGFDGWNGRLSTDHTKEEKEEKKKKKRKKNMEGFDIDMFDSLSAIVGWILLSSKSENSNNKHIRKAKEMCAELLIDKDDIVEMCVEQIMEREIHKLIPFEHPFAYVSAVLHRDILPKLRKENV